MFKRRFVDTLVQRFKEPTPLIQCVLGPRQVGKTTGILQFLEEYSAPSHYVSADALLTAGEEWLLEQWQAALLKGEETLLVIDEIQKIPRWSETVKKLWDEQKIKKTRVKLLLSGSSSLPLTAGMSESLAGRFETLFVYHWDYLESNELVDFSIDSYLDHGGYPESYGFLNDEQRWLDYLRHSVIDRVVDKDILAYARIGKPALFRQTFEMICCYPAQEISYRKLLGQIQEKGNTDLVKHYLSLFEGAFLIKTLQKYQSQDFKIKSSSPKILLLAPCFYHVFSARQDKQTFLFENTVGAKLCELSRELYYWRDDNLEVDFVVQFQNRLFAVEVKSGRKKRVGGLKAFCLRYPEALPVIITRENYAQFIESPAHFFQRLGGLG